MKKATIFICIFQLFSCQKDGNSLTSNKYQTMKTPECLFSQLKAGFSAEKSETDYPNYTYKETDLDCSIPILVTSLQNSGYTFPSNDSFSQRVYAVFNRKIDYNISSKYVYIDGNNQCDKNIHYNTNEDGIMDNLSYYLVKSNNFITELFAIPEIIDYEKYYPESMTVEKEAKNNQDGIKITKWNENKNLINKREENIKKTISRNKYLFNNSQSDLVWLLANDKNFLKMLVIIYGYDKEEKINKMVLEEKLNEYTNTIPDSRELLGDIIFVKDCQGKLQIRDGLLNYIAKHTTKDDDRYIYGLGNYANLLFSNDSDHLFSENLQKKFTFEEKAKIVAYIANIESPAFYEYKPLTYQSKGIRAPESWSNAATTLYNISVEQPEILDTIKKNHYYGLKPLQKAVESDDFTDEYTN